MCQVWRWGSCIRWFTAASDNGIGEVNSTSDGPHCKATEESESSKYSQGIVRELEYTRRYRRADGGNAEIVEAIAGRISWGTLESVQYDDVEMEISFKCGERNRST